MDPASLTSEPGLSSHLESGCRVSPPVSPGVQMGMGEAWLRGHSQEKWLSPCEHGSGIRNPLPLF